MENMMDMKTTLMTTAIQLDKLYKRSDKSRLSDYMSTRMVKCAAMLTNGNFLGWQMTVPQKGRIRISLFGSDALGKSDLKWIGEKSGKFSSKGQSVKEDEALTELYELYLPIAEGNGYAGSIGFAATGKAKIDTDVRWPSHFSSQFTEFVKLLQDTGANFRVTLCSATLDEQEACRKVAVRTYNHPNINAENYIGIPIKMKVLLRLPTSPSVRLRTILGEAVAGAKLRYLGSMCSATVSALWNEPLSGTTVLPDYAARFLMMEPTVSETIVGIDACEEEIKQIPATHKNPKASNAVEIGHALDVSSGKMRKITVGEMDLKRHYQIIGQTGTGKSTLLSNIILDAIAKGYGLTFFDPHGSTIDVVLQSLPRKYADKVRVVRIGDAEHPVPLNIWDSDDFVKEERNISDLCELFSDIFDPRREGFVGPRYERWLSTFAKASIAFLGRRASLESIAIISQSQDNMLKLSKKIVSRYPELVEIIKEEYGLDKSSDFHNVLNWYLCKFQRLTSVEQLRKTLGAGTNVLDFNHSIDTDTVTLIDLASPTIGTHAARIIGTLMMMKLWNATLQRKERDKTHMVVVDEASLFQTNPMPRMLAESRKFGIAMVLCHQHTGQLTQEIRDALEANSANLTAFRLSAKDAFNAAVRFDDSTMQISLTRLPAFQGITTLSVNGNQTAPFTLKVTRPKKQRDGEQVKAEIEKRSIETLVAPYEHLKALTSTEILAMLNSKEVPPQVNLPPANSEHVPAMSNCIHDDSLEDDMFGSDDLPECDESDLEFMDDEKLILHNEADDMVKPIWPDKETPMWLRTWNQRRSASKKVA